MGDTRLKIFISAFACAPDRGSEIGVGWHWVLEMSKYFALQDAIFELTNEDLRNKFGSKAMKIARRNTWKNKGEEIYQTIIERYVENSLK